MLKLRGSKNQTNNLRHGIIDSCFNSRTLPWHLIRTFHLSDVVLTFWWTLTRRRNAYNSRLIELFQQRLSCRVRNVSAENRVEKLIHQLRFIRFACTYVTGKL